MRQQGAAVESFRNEMVAANERAFQDVAFRPRSAVATPSVDLRTTVLGHTFALPFLLLLSRRTKRTPSRVRVIAFVVLIMRVVDITWTIGPVFRGHGSSLHWLDFALVLGMGSIWLALFWSNLAKRSLLPAHDPYFKEALSHAGH